MTKLGLTGAVLTLCNWLAPWFARLCVRVGHGDINSKEKRGKKYHNQYVISLCQSRQISGLSAPENSHGLWFSYGVVFFLLRRRIK